MTPQQVALVRQSWRVLEPDSTEIALAFYARLFELDGRMATLFAHTGLEAHAGKFTQAISALVDSLDNPESFVPLFARLGRDHAAVGVTDRQYRIFGEALLATLHGALEPAWNVELRDAWAETYLLAASIMRRAGARISGAFGEVA